MKNSSYAQGKLKKVRKSSFHIIVRLTLFAGILISGCSTVTETDLNIPLKVPENYTINGSGQQSSTWWLDLNDQGLAELIDRALKGNLNVKAIGQRLVQARATANIAGAERAAGLDWNVNGTESVNRTDGETDSQSNVNLGLASSYEIDLWGRLQAKEDAAFLESQASALDIVTAQLTLASEVALTWYQLGLTQARLDLLEEQQQINQLGLDIIQVRFNGGQVGYADVLQQKQLIESKIGEKVQQISNSRILENRLAVLSGTSPGALKHIKNPDLIQLPVLPEIGVPLDLLQNRPDILAYKLELLAADRRVAAAIGDSYPRLSLSANISTSGTTSVLFSNWLATLAANLVGPLFDSGKRKLEIERAKAVTREKLNLFGQATLEAIGEVEDALFRENQQRKLITSLERQLDLANQTVESVKSRYKLGGENYQRVLTAILSQQSLQRDILIARERLIEFRIYLYRALGGARVKSST